MNHLEREIKIIQPKGLNSETKKIRVAPYCRVSTDSSDQLNSFFAQIKYYNDYIRCNENMVLVDIYADEGITGTSIKKREDFKRLLRDCKERKIDRVIVKSVTRFARNSLECLESIRQMKSYGVSVFFENDNIDTEYMNSEMLLYIKSAFAQGEAISASKRMKTSIRMKMEDGTFKLAIAPYGYRLVDGKLVVQPEEAEKVKKIFELYLTGMGPSKIIKYMKSIGDTTNWKISQITYILKNEKYIGDCLLQKSYSIDTLPFKKVYNKGELAQYYYHNTHEAIISKEIFDLAKSLRESTRKKVYFQNIRPEKFFSKKLKCRCCNWRYKYTIQKSDIYWACAKKSLATANCQSPNLSNEELCNTFIKLFNRLKENQKIIIDETILEFQKLKKIINKGNNELEDIDSELATMSKQNNTYGELYASGAIDELTFIEKTDKIKKRATELRTRRIKIVNEDEQENYLEDLKKVKKILNQNKDYMTTFDEKIFNSIVEKIYVENDNSLTFCIKGELNLNIGIR